MAIRYDEKLNKQILKTVRNFNAKVARLERQGVQLTVEKVSVREIKKEYTNRRDLLSYMRELRKFSQRGVERIAYVDRWEKQFSVYDFKVGYVRQRRAIREGERLLAEAKETHRTEGGTFNELTLMGTDYAANLEANLERLKSERYSTHLRHPCPQPHQLQPWQPSHSPLDADGVRVLRAAARQAVRGVDGDREATFAMS